LSPDCESEKKFKNQLIFGKIIRCTNNGAIFGPPCITSRVKIPTANHKIELGGKFLGIDHQNGKFLYLEKHDSYHGNSNDKSGIFSGCRSLLQAQLHVFLILNSDVSCCLNISSAWTWTTMATPVNVNFG